MGSGGTVPLAVVPGCSSGDRKHLLGLHREKNNFWVSPPSICSSYFPLKLFCQLCLLIYHHQLFSVLWTDIFLDSNLLIILCRICHIWAMIKKYQVFWYTENYKDSLVISFWIFLSAANNLVPCPKSTFPPDTYTLTPPSKALLLSWRCSNWPFCYSFRLVWFLFPKLVLN